MWESESKERERVRSEPEREAERETPGERGFCRGFGCSCIITPTADKAYLCLSFPSLSIQSLVHTYNHTHTLYCMCQQRPRESCTGEKRGNMRDEAKEGMQREENGE